MQFVVGEGRDVNGNKVLFEDARGYDDNIIRMNIGRENRKEQVLVCRFRLVSERID